MPAEKATREQIKVFPLREDPVQYRAGQPRPTGDQMPPCYPS